MIDYLTIAEALKLLKLYLEDNPVPLTIDMVETWLIDSFLEADPSFHVGSGSYDHVNFRNDSEVVRS
jgi:hypothetical protein